jgi:hypothetical protein
VQAPPPNPTLAPNAIAFRDPGHGILGTGFDGCRTGVPFDCRATGTISLTSNGGRTWRVVVRTPRPVTHVSVSGGVERAILDDGENLASVDRGRTWHPAEPERPLPGAPCPYSELTDVVGGPGDEAWALCTGEPGAGNQDKAIYRLVHSRWQRVAWAVGGNAHGGIDEYGYPEGIAVARDGFGVIWEGRGTLYVTRNGGSSWTGLPKVARPEEDFGTSAAVLAHGVGFAILRRGGSVMGQRLIETTDAGRSWRVIHRWR